MSSDVSDPNARSYVILHSTDPGLLRARIVELENARPAPAPLHRRNHLNLRVRHSAKAG